MKQNVAVSEVCKFYKPKHCNFHSPIKKQILADTEQRKKFKRNRINDFSKSLKQLKVLRWIS